MTSFIMFFHDSQHLFACQGKHHSYAFILDFQAPFYYDALRWSLMMGTLLSYIPFASMGGSVLGVTFSLLLVTVMLGLWVLVLMILHPLHAAFFLITSLAEYGLISWFGFHLWPDFFAFFGIYIGLFAFYALLLRRYLPLPKTEIEHLIKLTQLKQENLLSDEEFKKAKKKLLKL